MTVWDREYGTLDQFARAIASRTGEQRADAYGDLLAAIWRGEFEQGGHCSVVLPELDGSWVGTSEGGMSVYEDKEGNAVPIPRPPISRADLRSVLMGDDTQTKNIRPELRPELPSFELLAERSLGPRPLKAIQRISTRRYVSEERVDSKMSDEDLRVFREAYLDRLQIETAAVQRWLSKRWEHSAAARQPDDLSAPGGPSVVLAREFEDTNQPAEVDQSSVRQRPQRDNAKRAIEALEKQPNWRIKSFTEKHKSVNDWLLVNGTKRKISERTLRRAMDHRS